MKKLCAACFTPKPLEAFYRCTTGKHGRQSRCIACMKTRDERQIHRPPAFIARTFARDKPTRAEVDDAIAYGVPLAIAGVFL